MVEAEDLKIFDIQCHYWSMLLFEAIVWSIVSEVFLHYFYFIYFLHKIFMEKNGGNTFLGQVFLGAHTTQNMSLLSTAV